MRLQPINLPSIINSLILLCWRHHQVFGKYLRRLHGGVWLPAPRRPPESAVPLYSRWSVARDFHTRRHQDGNKPALKCLQRTIQIMHLPGVFLAKSVQGTTGLWTHVRPPLVRSSGGLWQWENQWVLLPQLGPWLLLLLQLLGLLWVPAEEQPPVDSQGPWGPGRGVRSSHSVTFAKNIIW